MSKKAKHDNGTSGSKASVKDATPLLPPSERVLDDSAATFAMLASPIRLHVLWLLSQEPKDVGTLAEAVGSSVATVSQHLAKMKLADLVTSRRDGKRQVYRVDDPHIVTLVYQVLDHHAELLSRRP